MDIAAFLASPEGLALKAALALAGVDFLFGVYAAIRDGTFALDAIAAFLRKHLLEKRDAIVRDLDAGTVVSSLSDTTAGHLLEVRVSDGAFGARVEIPRIRETSES